MHRAAQRAEHRQQRPQRARTITSTERQRSRSSAERRDRDRDRRESLRRATTTSATRDRRAARTDRRPSSRGRQARCARRRSCALRAVATDAEPLHAPVQRLPAQAELGRGLRDDARRARERLLDRFLVERGIGLGACAPRRRGQAEVGGAAARARCESRLARCITFLSSRTLPGHAWRSSARLRRCVQRLARRAGNARPAAGCRRGARPAAAARARSR